MTTATTQRMDEVLREQFGLKSFRDGQRQVIERLLAGKSAAAVFPTGGGKSLCYQLPAVLLDGLTLVVSPLLALMREQVDSLIGKGIKAARLDSSLSAEEARLVMQEVRNGTTKLLYVAPERFFNERFRDFITDIPIAMFAIDEAHCISQWGHNFRPDYLKLAKISKQLDAQRILALTATATPAVLDDIRREFSIALQDAILTPFYRSNLTLRFTLADERSRDATLVQRLKEAPAQPSLVYVTLQKTAEEVAERLQASGLPAHAYHAGMDAEERARVQDLFMSSQDAIIVATIAFGMGVDKSNIRAIYHYNPSKSLENLAQEIGRAGRDGEPAVCESLLVPEDRVVLENFAYGDTPSVGSVRRFVEFLVGQPENFFVSYYSLAHEADMRDSVVRTLMTYLELEEFLVGTAPRYESYKFKARVPSSQILAHFEGERRSFAASVLALTVKKRIWFEISLPQAANRLKCDRARIVKMLDFFAEKGWIELQVSGLVHGYRKHQPIADIEELTQELYQYTLDREIGELGRLNELFELMCSTDCQCGGLSQHFGQPLASPCGHCSACEGQAIEELPEPDYPRIGDSALTAVRQLSKKHPEQLGDARSQARFLCGMTSPRMVRARLSRDAMFGCCSAIPFDRVLESLLG
ncbi:RecQ family ATP-dependent DNA helicase [Aureliella helgolandensis]|uniref:DNA 3'-5' helicase n=1 Tax=Aureliella helgolandensis TaxID=2527968 RepID=A0A518G199_9BACT|nr:ATP-dependent DNA helicase RecQ [Aureliella helgolandensis]QDV22314.1 ATP-dependent DNA helicase RecQ [Aureliella helgolandensis]